MDQGIILNKNSLRDLRRQTTGSILIATVLLLGGFAAMYQNWIALHAIRWLQLSALVTAYLTLILWRGLPLNHPPGDDRLLPSLGWGNLTTLLRGFLIACLAGFLFSPRPPGWLAWVPGILYLLAVIADLLDGYLARVRNHTTILGEHLDMRLDGLGILVAVCLVVQYGQVPWWYLFVGLARYFFLFGIWLRKRFRKPVYDLNPSVRRRAFAGVQMCFIAALLYPIFSPPGTHAAALFFGLPFLVAFLLDWLTTCGYKVTGKPSVHGIKVKIAYWVPLTLRLTSLVLGILILISSSSTIYGSKSTAIFLSLLEFIAALFIFFGIAGRIAAIAGLVLLGFIQVESGLSPYHYSLLIVYTAIIYLGTGPFSIWTPEDQVINQRLGDSG